VTLLTAILGTAAMSPITAAGRNGQRWQEGLVTVGFVTVGITIVAASILVLSRLRRTPMS
jgi:hydroxylaminobenzene mutase